MYIFMDVLKHIGGEQISMFFQGFLVQNDAKRWQFCNLINARANVHFSRVTKSFIFSRHIILGHPVYQFLPKLEFSDFTVSATGFWKYVSLCSSNSYITYYGIQVGDAKLRYILLICWCDSISKFGYEREIGIVMSNAMQWSSYTPTRWKIVGRMN